jgi:poly(3-hydroxybutyrate) depolymerase
MQTNLNLLAAGIILAAVHTGFSQSTLQFTAASCTVVESTAAVALIVQRVNDTNTIVSVDYATADGTATNGFKYTAVSGPLVFGPGETKQIILVPLLNDGLVGGTKTFRVLLSNPTNAILGMVTNATVSILDSDKGLHFYVPAISVNEDAGEVEIKVARGDDGDMSASVDYATANGTAIAGQDYTTNAGTIVFAPGEVLQSFAVPLLNDALAEPTKTFRVTLSNPTGGAVLSTPTFVTVTITNTDQVVQFDSTRYYAREEAEFVQIGVTRGESDSAASVDFTTTDGTARADLDFTGVTNTIPFGAGERSKQISVPLLHDPLKESSETFQVRLSNPTGGDVLGSRTIATMTIADNDPGVGFTRSVSTYWTNVAVATVDVLRGRDDLLSSFTVDYQTYNGSAQAGVDYQTTNGTLYFEANQTLQVVTIPLLQTPAAASTKYFMVRLSNASGGVPLGLLATRVNLFHPKGYYPIVPRLDAKPRLARENGVNLLSWEGDAVLQRADQVTGPWEDLAQVSNPYATKPNLPKGFYRIQSARPTEVYVPAGYDGQTPLPLILALHALGTGANGAVFRSAINLEPLAESRGFLVCYPSGTVDAAGRGFWNGPDFLSFSGPDVNDSGYLRAVIEEIQRRFAVDPKRIYVTGFSSGGAMAHRLALEYADLIAGIASMAGRTYYDPNACRPTLPVNVLMINGSLDTYLGWTGPDYGLPFVAEAPGAFKTVQIWAGLNGCQNPVFDAAPSLDLTTQVAGIDTTVLRYTQCPPGGSVELWTVNGGDHYLFWNNLAPHSLEYLVDWLLAHPKP